MKAFGCLCMLVGLSVARLQAQQPDSVQVLPADSLALQRFLIDTGPAEAVFSFIAPPPYKFKSGVYAIGDLAFPLRNSPDSLVRFPIERAFKQRRRARISGLATAVPLGVLVYSVVSVLFAVGSAITGRQPSLGLPSEKVIRVSGIAAVAGITLTGTFNIASTINLQKGIRKHNSRFGRKLPTIFNPKGL